jgi:hypothetical protein
MKRSTGHADSNSQLKGNNWTGVAMSCLVVKLLYPGTAFRLVFASAQYGQVSELVRLAICCSVSSLSHVGPGISHGDCNLDWSFLQQKISVFGEADRLDDQVV